MSSQSVESKANEVQEPKPDTKYSWFVCACAFLCLMLTLGTNTSFGVYQVYYIDTKFPDKSPSTISWIGSITVAMMLFSGIIAGKLNALFGYRITAWIGCLFSIVGLVSASFCDSVGTLMVTQGVILGIGNGLIYITSVSITAMWFEKYRGVALGIIFAGSGVGGIVLTNIVSAILKSLGYKWALRICAVFFVVIVGLSALSYKPRVPISKNVNIIDLSGIKDFIFISSSLCGFIGNLGFIVPIYFLPPDAISLGASDSQATLISTLFNVGLLIGGVVLGAAVDIAGPLNTFLVSTFLSGFFQLLLWIIFPSVSSFFALTFLYGFFLSGFLANCIAVIGKYFAPERIPALNGSYFLICAVSLIVSNFAISALISEKPNGDTDYKKTVILSSMGYMVGALCLIPGILVARSRLKGETSWRF
ncbi:putative transporter MCH2 [Zancudomyces culisetae]|uniref:Putative transporter MCH2 n=1 Tax=Zancudomyces culisetae TaxID=1213189 RepID=A0A1R1PJT7_ZANCU|nr:putative transporter MCH2 [Zancudomyces culisetae]OMH84109.1 putative transporter MCH2 [Zancudomyces culisetae]|eukprot:OMH81207.1 putative transporter MCH2 [Zancudomyces culisetae]